MAFFRKFVIILSCALMKEMVALKNTETDIKCASECTCTEELLSNVPIMKWLTIPMETKYNAIQPNNDVLDNDEKEEDVLQGEDPIVFAAFCTARDSLSTIRREKFTPAVEALTLLFGPATSNKEIVHEFHEFSELIALDLQGYEPKPHSPYNSSELQLHHDALRELHNIRYLNLQNIRVFPRQEDNQHLYNQSALPRNTNLTFLVPNDEELLSYDEYRNQKNVVSTFSHLDNLQFLRLFRCYIDSITWEMFDGLYNLRTLSLQNNDIAELPEFAFYGTPRLQSLILSQNKIQRVRSESLAGLFHLEKLDLSGNQLKTLSDNTFAPLPKLRTLDLLGNPLENLLSNTFETTNATQSLRIGSSEGLIMQENAFSSLNQLETLTLLGLNASKLYKEMLRGLTNLKYFRMSGNVDSLTFDTFTGSLLLEELVLRHCSLKSISVDAFYGLTRLKRLDLSRNKLQTLQPGVFDQLTSLKELILSRNHFVTLPRLVLANLQRVNVIRLELNPWNCSCDMIEWGSLNITMKKVTQTTKQPCNYRYDKIPCTSIQTEVYVRDLKATPKCATPKEYEGWNVLRAVYSYMECADGTKNVPKKYPKFKKAKLRRFSSVSDRRENEVIQTNGHDEDDNNNSVD